MGVKEWKDNQIQAISLKSSDMLVSASAGTGKTAVLSERLARKIIGGEADISEILAVTYTKAAASDLKRKIGDRLREGLDGNTGLISGAEPIGREKLKEQIDRLENAHISTIHSFCYDLIKEYCAAAGVSPDSRIADEVQLSILKKNVAYQVISLYCEGNADGYDDINDIVTLTEILDPSGRNEEDALIDLYDKLSSYPEGINVLSESVAEYEKAAKNGFETTKWYGIVCDDIASELDYIGEALAFSENKIRETCLEKIEKNAKSETVAKAKEYLNSLEALLSNIAAAKKLVADGKIYDAKAIFNSSAILETSRAPGGLNDIKKDFAGLSGKIPKKNLCNTETLLSEMNDVYALVRKFDFVYKNEKARRNLLDYSDLERIAYLLLSDETIASATAGKYKEIFIDEYQDVNAVQAGIFSALAKHCPRFMVGDIKQSIYCFRAADPSVFNSYRENPDISKVYLKHNFRSGGKILDFANRICGRVLREGCSMMRYTADDDLVCGSEERIGDGEVKVLAVNGDGNAEARTVAAEVKRLIFEEHKSAKDICILTRNRKDGAKIGAELKKADIECASSEKVNILKSPIVMLAVSLLNITDNPNDDIHLTAVLKSPLYGFSLEELIKIGRGRSGSLFDAFSKWTEETDDPRGRKFLSALESFRQRRSEPVDSLLWYIYCATGIFSLSADPAEEGGCLAARRRLVMLHENARAFENGTFKGLYRFIEYLNDTMESGKGIEIPFSPAEDSVVISTVHSSKGLDFDTVFLCAADGKLSKGSDGNKLLFDRRAGLVIPVFTGEFTYESDRTFPGLAVKAVRKRSETEENMRLMYVALTRAKNLQYLTASVKNAEKKPGLDKFAELRKVHGSADGLRRLYLENDTFIKWYCIASAADGGHEMKAVEPPAAEDGVKCVVSEEEADGRLVEELKRRFEYKYEGPGDAIPAKLSVSKLYPDILDEGDVSTDLTYGRAEPMVPAFISDPRCGASDRGTATHTFMQFCDFGKLAENGAEKELERLFDEKFLDEKTAKLVDTDAVNAFSRSSVAQRMKKSAKMWRELRFNVFMPASEFTSDKEKAEKLNEENVLVQGIIDCLFEDENGKLVLVDYKTDAWKNGQSRTDFIQQLKDRHGMQLGYYRRAVKTVTGREADETLIYSFALNECVKL